MKTPDERSYFGSIELIIEGKDKMTFYPNERIALFIDGANFYAAARTLGFDVDYRKLLEEFKKRGRLIRASYYTAILEDVEYSPVRPLADWLDYNGFNVITKPAKEYTDSMGRRRVKGDMDIEIAVDMMELAGHVDHVVLFSGDGDFRHLVEAVQRRGPRVSVVSSIKTQPPMIADELRRQADTFIDLSDLASLIGRPPRPDGYENPRAAMRPGRPATDDASVDLDDDIDDEMDDELEATTEA
jgi:uncharacterized LabA/DUF88 family protein